VASSWILFFSYQDDARPNTHQIWLKYNFINISTHLHRIIVENKRPTWCHLLFYFTTYVLNMFRTLIYPSSGACEYSVELPHWSYCSWFDVCWEFRCGWVGVVSVLQAEAQFCFQNNTTNVVIQQHSRKLLMRDILMSETCWAHKKWNKKASDIKLVFYSSAITMMHGLTNIRFT